MDLTAWAKDIDLGHGLKADVSAFLSAHNRMGTLTHAEQVAAEAVRLAQRFGVDCDQADQAAWLHDISAVIPYNQRIEVARAWGLPILPEEEAYPVLLHQGLSVVLSRELFGIRDEAVLAAIGCHTTLRAGSTPLDQVLFVADKIAWDQGAPPPYLAELNDALSRSLAGGARFFLEYLQLHASGPVHPWVHQALADLI
jgi:predicted HD superfamily hydrolase involved in NAD metabolism